MEGPSPLQIVVAVVVGVATAALIVQKRKRKTVPNLPDDLDEQ